MPISVLQAVEASQTRGLQQIYSRIAQRLNCKIPAGALDDLLTKIIGFEDLYVESDEACGGMAPDEGNPFGDEAQMEEH
jgi:hypothetical protein